MDFVPDELVTRIKQRMHQIIKEDYLIKREVIGNESALEYFEKMGRKYAKLLVESNNDPFIMVDECNGYINLHHRPLVATTGQIEAGRIQFMKTQCFGRMGFNSL